MLNVPPTRLGAPVVCCALFASLLTDAALGIRSIISLVLKPIENSRSSDGGHHQQDDQAEKAADGTKGRNPSGTEMPQHEEPNRTDGERERPPRAQKSHSAPRK